MEKLHIQAEIEVQKLLAQLDTKQLEVFLREISALIKRRKTKDQRSLELELLQSINEECVLSPEHWKLYRQLKSKREAKNITEQELTKLSELIKEEEGLRLKRIQLLGELAELRGISLPQLTKELGIYPPSSV